MSTTRLTRPSPFPACLLLPAAGLAFVLAMTAGEARAQAPTWYQDVMPIVEESCAACHQPAGLNLGGMVAPMSLVTYEDSRPWAAMMAEQVERRTMPPWHASRAFEGTFEGERYLDESEIETIVAWADAGAPEGDKPAGYEPPEVEETPSEWALGEPDLVLEFDEPYCLADDVEDVYVTTTAPLTEEMLPEDRWIKSVEYKPGPRVHHILRGLGGLAPGNQPQIYENGYGRLLEKGTRVIPFDMHYNKPAGPGTGSCDNTTVGVRFMEPGEVVRYRTRSEMAGIMDFLIPPGDPSYTDSREFEIEEDAYITALTPHMHLRGKAALYELIYPDGLHETLLHVPKYDFSWQHTYTFREPVMAPAGSKVRLTLWWDNSAENPSNPDPTEAVRFGEPTTAEMGFGFIAFRAIEEDSIVVGEPLPPEIRAAYGGTIPMDNDGGNAGDGNDAAGNDAAGNDGDAASTDAQDGRP